MAESFLRRHVGVVENFEIFVSDGIFSTFIQDIILIFCLGLYFQGCNLFYDGWGFSEAGRSIGCGYLKVGSSIACVNFGRGLLIKPLMATSTRARWESQALITCLDVWKWLDMGVKPRTMWIARSWLSRCRKILDHKTLFNKSKFTKLRLLVVDLFFEKKKKEKDYEFTLACRSGEPRSEQVK